MESAGATFNSLFTTLRSTISRSCDPTPTPCTHKNVSPPENPSPSESAEVERLQAVVEKLRADLGRFCLVIHLVNSYILRFSQRKRRSKHLFPRPKHRNCSIGLPKNSDSGPAQPI